MISRGSRFFAISYRIPHRNTYASLSEQMRGDSAFVHCLHIRRAFGHYWQSFIDNGRKALTSRGAFADVGYHRAPPLVSPWRAADQRRIVALYSFRRYNKYIAAANYYKPGGARRVLFLDDKCAAFCQNTGH